MWRDLPKSLISAVSTINQQSRKAFAEEQATQAQKKPKLPGVPAPKADTAAVANAADMAKKNVKEEAGGTTPKSAKEKSLAKLAPPANKITHADVMVGRGVKKEEVEQVDEISAGLATSYLNKRDAQHKPNMNSPETSNRDAKVAKGMRGAVSRMHGFGPDKNAENKVTGRFDYRKKVGATHVFNKEETEDASQVEEGWDDMIKAAKERNKPQPNGGSGVKQGSRYGGSKQKDDKEEKNEKEMKENTDTPGNSSHQCAVHVKSEQFGEGKTLFSQHAEPDAQGNIAWYDVMFAEGIKRVETKDIEIVVSESHMNHKKKK
ncbi:hypothetical protein EBT25_08420 [bacterium]|nr:hypothetical protein [bacterium]